MTIESLNAVTLATHDMARAVEFYRTMGFRLTYGGPEAPFTTFEAGSGHLNLVLETTGREWSWWGRAIFFVASVDETWERAVAAGFQPEAPPADAAWGERYFHITDPDGHELSFARPLA
ncbi:MAG: VOC family protein [Planctomycetota bacterium]|jgi:catechol 2,3-dioxygenase-like lactoylglutathione lyase family enzyme